MPFQLDTDPRVIKEINKLNLADRAKIKEYIDLFREFGFALGPKYLKKVNKLVWELRPNRWRLFILIISPQHIIIHLMYKQSQQITKKTKKIIDQRTKEYL